MGFNSAFNGLKPTFALVMNERPTVVRRIWLVWCCVCRTGTTCFGRKLSSDHQSNCTFHGIFLNKELDLISSWFQTCALFWLCFLLGNSPESEFYMPTFRNTLFHLNRLVGISSHLPANEDGTDRVFRNVGI